MKIIKNNKKFKFGKIVNKKNIKRIMKVKFKNNTYKKMSQKKVVKKIYYFNNQ